MPRESMTPREGWQAVVRREAPDRVPMDYWAPAEATQRLMGHLGCSSTRALFERLHIDAVVSVGPRYVGPPLAAGEDVFGCRTRNVDYGTGVYAECVYHPLAEYASVAEIREFLIPRMKRMIDLAHQAGVTVFHHSDGAIRPIIPDMIAVGIDVLNPIQWRCKGMERAALKRDFGDRVVFHGGVDNQYTLAFGTTAEVRREVEENLRILGAGGGYIVAPYHNIQAVSPPENVVAMYETGYALGWA